MATRRAENTKVVLILNNLHNPTSEDEREVAFDVSRAMNGFVDTVSPSFKSAKEIRGTLERMMLVGEDHACAVLKLEREGLPRFVTALEELSHYIRKNFEDVAKRYAEAMRLGTPIRRTKLDKQMLRLNSQAWMANQFGWNLVMFPEERFGWCVEPVDPTTLECEAPEEKSKHVIVGARVLGAYEQTGGVQLDLFMGERIDWIVVLDHEIGQIRHQMKRSSGQDINRGITYLSATVEGLAGEIPRVIGDIKLVRAKDWIADD